jgi:hypothetical protein
MRKPRIGVFPLPVQENSGVRRKELFEGVLETKSRGVKGLVNGQMLLEL